MENKINLHTKKLFSFAFVLLLMFSFVSAHGDEVLAKAEEIINAETPCSELTEDDFEALGDYSMERMHPGDNEHERMDMMMGGEGTEELRRFHINMGESFYCGASDGFSFGMMDLMTGQGGFATSGDARVYGPIFNAILFIGVLILIILVIRKTKGAKR